MPSKPKSPEQRERLAAALRENLKRRKARARALASGQDPAACGQPAKAPDLPSSEPQKADKPER